MPRQKVLVVDDSTTDLKLISGFLSSAGYTVIKAVDGEDALKMVQQENPDLVVLDIIMPKINGFDVCRKIKTSADLKKTKIIMVSSKSQESDKFWGMKQGADIYMTKPFSSEELITNVEQLF
ncbi:MAG: response regulator [Desulfobacteraceae bacterium]|nr:response regulator [Desulfobacteraceae bacterium]